MLFDKFVYVQGTTIRDLSSLNEKGMFTRSNRKIFSHQTSNSSQLRKNINLSQISDLGESPKYQVYNETRLTMNRKKLIEQHS